MFAAYRSTTGKDIEDSIKSEMSGDLEDGMLTIGKNNTLPNSLIPT